MIKPLAERLLQDSSGAIYGSSCPDNWEIKNKVNEIINWINKFEKLNKKE